MTMSNKPADRYIEMRTTATRSTTMRYQGYQCSGRHGTVRQLLINGEAYYHDSVIEDGDGEAINKLERSLGDAIHYEMTPLFGDFTQEQMEEYVGA